MNISCCHTSFQVDRIDKPDLVDYFNLLRTETRALLSGLKIKGLNESTARFSPRGFVNFVSVSGDNEFDTDQIGDLSSKRLALIPWEFAHKNLIGRRSAIFKKPGLKIRPG